MSAAEEHHARLSQAFDEIKHYLECYAESRQGSTIAQSPGSLAKATRSPRPPGPLEMMFGLSDFEARVLLLTAGAEVDEQIASLCARVQNGAVGATFGLALAALPEPHWSAVSVTGPLRRWMLVNVAAAQNVVSSPLRIDERILNALLGLEGIDERLEGLLTSVPVPDRLTPTHEAAAKKAAAYLKPYNSNRSASIVQLCGPDPAEAASIAALAAASNGLRLMELDIQAGAKIATESSLVKLIEREMLLSNSALLIDTDDVGSLEGLPPAADIVATRLNTPIFLSSRQRRRLRRRTTVALEIERPPSEERRTLWQHALGDAAGEDASALDLLSDQFDLSAGGIAAVGHEVLLEGQASPETLWEACRRAARPRLDELAQRIETHAGWDDLILPDNQKEILHGITAQVRGRRVVYEQWGFSASGSRGLGITALFAGASGTGKTLAAEVLSQELKLDLYRVDLSTVMSKYIGETEKNLRKIFDAAEQGGSILLFDEADALFGKRSEVRDSHDRFANIEVSYLLQRMECYRGLAILTTNLKSALDTAFLRRIRFIVQFPFPDAAQRELMWKRAYPKGTPLDGLDFRRLAQMNLTGGHIRNIALGSAFLAAEAQEPVRMSHIAHASEAEYGKLEKPLTDAERAGWAELHHG